MADQRRFLRELGELLNTDEDAAVHDSQRTLIALRLLEARAVVGSVYGGGARAVGLGTAASKVVATWAMKVVAGIAAGYPSRRPMRNVRLGAGPRRATRRNRVEQ